MQNTPTTTTRGWFSVLQGLGAVLVAGLLVFATGCDSSGNDDSGGDAFTAASYDTTFGGPNNNTPKKITVETQDGGGILPDEEDNTVTWDSDIIYRLDGFVFVGEGETLEIEAGTEIRGETGIQEQASALIVSRGGKIDAAGEPDNPIVFTSVETEGRDLGKTDRGLWGGVILLGDAPINSGDEATVEGVPDQEGDRILYGGDNPGHDVGTFKYVSIRHTGTQLANGDEIQGLTMGGVGSGSTIEYVESYASNDDGFEWFGGTVNTKHLIAAYAADDAFDIDQGYRGSNQFWLAVQNGDKAGRASEMDGGTDPEDGTPLAASIVSNATYIGMGPGRTDAQVSGDANDPFLIHRDNNATSYYNSVFTGGRTDAGLQIEDLDGDTDAADQWDSGPLAHVSNTWHNIGPSFSSSTTFEDLIQLTGGGDRSNLESNLADYLRNNGSEIVTTSPLQDITRSGGDGTIQSFDPGAAGPAASASTTTPGDFGDKSTGVNDDFVSVSERGAFASGASWNLNGWTKIVAEGELTGQ